MKKRLLALMLVLALGMTLTGVAGAAVHTVRAGENLSGLAEKYLGDGSKWREIYEANRDSVSDPNLIYVGQQLTIPGGEAAEAPTMIYHDIELVECRSVESDASYWNDLFEAELHNLKIIRNLPTAYESEGWDNYISAANMVASIDPNAMGESEKALLKGAEAARRQLKQIRSAEDCIWYIWGEDMPVENADMVFSYTDQDNEDFRPFLVPYLLDDQNAVKGNLIVVSGGGYSSRANTQEGYPVAARFNELGYNCFVLQRRVTPYSANDIWADLQRSVRYIRYYGPQLELGGLDLIAAAGFSGGSATILGTVANFYGDVQPTVYDSGYTPDAVDAVNSDLDVVMPVYGPDYSSDHSAEYQGLVTENPNLPAMLIMVGADDDTAVLDCLTLYRSVWGKTTAEMYIYAQNPHGFGVGVQGTNSVYWPDMADSYMQQMLLVKSDDSVEVGQNAQYGVIPAKYTKYQEYTVQAPFGAVDVTCAVNEAETAFIIFFTAFGDQQTITGILNNGIATAKYDRTGFFSTDTQTLFNGTVGGTWKPVN